MDYCKRLSAFRTISCPASQGNFPGKPCKTFSPRSFVNYSQMVDTYFSYRASSPIAGGLAGRLDAPRVTEAAVYQSVEFTASHIRSFCRRGAGNPAFLQKAGLPANPDLPSLFLPSVLVLALTALLSPGQRNHPQEFLSLRFAVRAPIDRP